MDTSSWSNINFANYFYELWQPEYERKQKQAGVQIIASLPIAETMQS